LDPPDIPARAHGILHIPLQDWPAGEALSIDFFDTRDQLIDAYILSNGTGEGIQEVLPQKGKISLSDNKDQYIISCENDIKFKIDKNTGLFRNFTFPDETYYFEGPFLNLRTKGKEIIYSSHLMNDYGTGWKMKALSVKKKDQAVEITLIGDYSTLSDVEFLVQVLPDGTINTNYNVRNLPAELIRELGIKYQFENLFDSLSWRRNAYWSAYPVDHLSAIEGKIFLFTSDPKEYRKNPLKKWQYDTKSFYYEGIQDETSGQLIMTAKATKENILEYVLHLDDHGSIAVEGKGREGCRIDMSDNHIGLYINNRLDYPDISWGDYQRNILIENGYLGNVRIKVNSH
jgi:beta-galactosidase